MSFVLTGLDTIIILLVVTERTVSAKSDQYKLHKKIEALSLVFLEIKERMIFVVESKKKLIRINKNKLNLSNGGVIWIYFPHGLEGQSVCASCRS